ncbi:putative zinc protease [compost metagenome]
MNKRISIVAMLVVPVLLNNPAFAIDQHTPGPGQCLVTSLDNTRQIPTVSRDIQQWMTPSGARVAFVHAPELPMFDLSVSFAAGSSRDGDTPGLAALVNGMLNEGTANKDAQAIAEGFDSVGAKFTSRIERSSSIITLRSLSSATERKASIELFAQAISAPIFPEKALRQVKDQIIQIIRSKQLSATQQITNQIYGHLYQGHPYSNPKFGTTEGIASITQEQLRAFHRKAYTARNSAIVMVGDLTRAQAEEITALISSSMPPGPALPRLTTIGTVEPEIYHHEVDSPLIEMAIVLPSIGVDHPDFAALNVARQVFGGTGPVNRLMRELRDRRGLSYGAYAWFTPNSIGSVFAIETEVEARFSEPTKDLIEALFRAYLKEGPTEQELDDAKRYLTAKMALSFGDNESTLKRLSKMAIHGLRADYYATLQTQYQRMTLDQVKQAMAKHFDPEDLIYITAGPSVEQKPLPAPLARPAATACVKN